MYQVGCPLYSCSFPPTITCFAMCMYWQHKQISLTSVIILARVFCPYLLQSYFKGTAYANLNCYFWCPCSINQWQNIANSCSYIKIIFFFPWADTVPLEKCRVIWCAISKLKQTRAVHSIIHRYMNQELYLVVLPGTRMPIEHFWAPESILQTWAIKEEAFLIRWVSTLISIWKL